MKWAGSTLLELRILAGVMALALLASQSGCVRSGVATLPPPPSEETRSKFGRIGVTWAAEGIPPMLTLPAAGACSGSARGAVLGTVVGFALVGALAEGMRGGGGGHGIELVLLVFILAVAVAIIPVAVLIGSMYGASAAHPPEEVDAAIRTVSLAASDAGLRRGIAKAILERGRARTDEKLEWLEPGAPHEAYDSILEVGPLAVALVGPFQINPALRLTAAFSIRMIRASDGTSLYEGVVGWHDKDVEELFRWAEGDGSRIRVLLANEGALFAERVIDRIFLLHLLPMNREWKGRGPTKP